MGLLSRIGAFVTVVSLITAGATTARPNKTYYVDSVNGKDTNSGTSISTPIKSLDRVNTLVLKSGDTVSFLCGTEYNGTLSCKYGVTYNSYGTGDQPVIDASINASDADDWTATDYENVWEYNTPILLDAGNIIFDYGASVGYKIAEDINDCEGVISELKKDGQFLHATDRYVYLYSERNPAERFESIKIAYNVDAVTLADNVTVDGLKLINAGGHGMQAKSRDNVTVKNCTVAYCGGSLHKKGSRYGNGIEFWNGGNNLTVDNCSVYQIYDAGITFQGDDGSFTNVKITNNDVDKCTYGLEYFLNSNGIMQNIMIDGNVFSNCGYGWGRQRPDIWTCACINSWTAHRNKAENFVISNNYLKNSYFLLFLIESTEGTLPTMNNNKYIQEKGADEYFTKYLDNAESIYLTFCRCDSEYASEWMKKNDPEGSLIY